jgi:DNA-binding XRE family transcriptional regulator
MSDSDNIAAMQRELGRQLAPLRREAGLTQEGIAALAGFSRSTVSVAEIGRQSQAREFWEACDMAQDTGGVQTAGVDQIDAVRDAEQRAAFRDRMPSGSYLAISHGTRDGTAPEVIAAIEGAYARASALAVFRTRDEIGAFFGGCSMVEPGIVEVSGWRANGRRPANPPALRFLGSIGRKGKES